MVKEHQAKLAQSGREERSTRETREMLWSEALKTALARLKKTASDVVRDRKAAAWKVAVAAQLKTFSTVSNVWLADQLCMGAPDGVSRYVSELRRGQRKEAEKIRRKITVIMV